MPGIRRGNPRSISHMNSVHSHTVSPFSSFFQNISASTCFSQNVMASLDLQSRYSEQKNWFTKGQILLVSQIVAQTTKVNSWEFCITKVDILSFVPPNYKYLTFFVEFILILEWGQVNESVFLHIPSLAFFDLYHSIYPSGHALSHIPINLPLYSIILHHHLLPKLKHTGRVAWLCSKLLLWCNYQISIGSRSGGCTNHSKILTWVHLNHHEAFW